MTITDETRAAITRWAKGDYGCQAGAMIAVNSTLAGDLIPRYLDLADCDRLGVLDYDQARRDYDAGDLYLSTSSVFLLDLAAALAGGCKVAGKNLNLAGLWQLDRGNRATVLAALAVNLAVPEKPFGL